MTASLMDSTGRVLVDADPRWSDVWSSGTPVDVTVPPHGSRPRRRKLRAHRCTVPSGDVTISRGIPVTTRERTWLDLCTELPGDWTVAVTDHLLRIPRPRLEGRSRPWSTPEALARRVRAAHGRPGVARARRALARARIGADSPQETALRLALERAGIPEPLLNTPLEVPRGSRPLEPDLRWDRWTVAAEHDGRVHRSAAQVDRDIDRGDQYRDLGWLEVRLTARDARDDWRCGIDRVANALRSRGWNE